METANMQSENKVFKSEVLRKVLLVSGIISSLLYVAMNIIVASLYNGYDSASQTVSELSAIGAPTRQLWILMGFIYALLVIGFGVGAWLSGTINRFVRISGMLLIIYGVVSLGWPMAPMHQREVLAAGGGTFSDTMHLLFSGVTVLLMLSAMVFGAKAFGRSFRVYSVITIILLIAFGVWTGVEAPKLQANLPTPFLGIVERVLIAIFLLWITILAIMILQARTGKNQKRKNLTMKSWRSMTRKIF